MFQKKSEPLRMFSNHSILKRSEFLVLKTTLNIIFLICIIFFKLPFDYCDVIDFFLAIYLFAIIFSHLFIPHTDTLHKEVHSTLITFHIAGAADVYDFAEYINDAVVLTYIDANVLMGILSI